MDLAECYYKNDELVRKYLLKAVKGGFHPDRIDNTKFGIEYSKLKGELYKAYNSFWSNRDTSYFSEIEFRVSQDLIYNRKQINDGSLKNKTVADSVFLDNSLFLLNYSEKHGFPFKPSPSNFNYFRTSVDPQILAMHSPDENRWELLNYAIKSAEKGENSWRIPISINISFFTASSQETYNSHPLWLTYFDKNGNLNLDKSYLQLYSIKKLYDQDMIMNIKIQPSKYNLSEKKIIKQQLEEIKEALIQEFYFTPEQLTITDIPNIDEPDYRNIESYQFTLSEIR